MSATRTYQAATGPARTSFTIPRTAARAVVSVRTTVFVSAKWSSLMFWLADHVNNNPGAFDWAYFDIAWLKIYQ